MPEIPSSLERDDRSYSHGLARLDVKLIKMFVTVRREVARGGEGRGREEEGEIEQREREV